MSVGSIVFATKSGLGVLAKLLYDYGIIDKVYIADHSKFDKNTSWYSRKDICLTRTELLESVDTLLIIEAPLPNPFNWDVVSQARSMNKRVVLMPMYESTPRENLHLADKIICPSVLDLEYYKDFDSEFLQVPAPRDIEWRERTEAKVFVHNAGHGGIYSRNGTSELIKAIPMIKSRDIEILIRVQPDAPESLLNEVESIEKDSRVVIKQEHTPYSELWSYGDVFVFPEKFNGLSLPVQEAYSAGMMVMVGDRSPFNQWLPKEPLIDVQGYFNIMLPIGMKIKGAIISPEDIAKNIDKWAGKNISKYSEMGARWSMENSNKEIIKKYRDVLYD